MEKTLDEQIAAGSKIPVDNIVSRLKHFSEQHKLMLVLYYCENLDYAEISQVMNMPVDNIKYTMNKMFKRLKDC